MKHILAILIIVLASCAIQSEVESNRIAGASVQSVVVVQNAAKRSYSRNEISPYAYRDITMALGDVLGLLGRIESAMDLAVDGVPIKQCSVINFGGEALEICDREQITELLTKIKEQL